MKGQFITYEEHLIHYYKMGHGPKIILAFHGFGLDGQCFLPLAAHLEAQYTIYSFDLFYHGSSFWRNNNESLTKLFWEEFIEYFTKEYPEKFSILCFSLGGKFALALAEQMPDKIQKIIFIAPDGIKTQLWYNLATYPLIFQPYFKSMIVKPQRFFSLLSVLKKIGLVDKSISKFVASQMNSTKKRRRVYYSWVIFKCLNFNLKQVADVINKYNIEIAMVLGKYDKIITPKGMDRLLRKLDRYDLYMLESGHNDLIKKLSHTPDLNKIFDIKG